MKESVNRTAAQAMLDGLFVLGLLLGVAVIWASPHPPMVDLPQHAGQLRLLHDLALGQSPWADLIEVNPWTPYLIAFGLALPLSMVFPIAMSLQLVLTAAYLGFVYGCVRLRKEFGSPASLDWLFLFSFFGFAFKWGFLTFQVAAPFGLAFILLSARYARAPSVRRALLIGTVGLVLLVSHALIFLYAVMVGSTLLLRRARQRRLLTLASPFMFLLLACLAYSLMRAAADARYGIPPTVPSVNWHAGLRHEILFYSFGTGWTPLFAFACTASLIAPWLAGFRIQWRDNPALAPMVVLLGVLLLAPHFALETAMLYQRFALLLFPAYAWIFSSKVQGKPAVHQLSKPAIYLLAAASLLVLAANVRWAWAYRSEAQDFQKLTASLEPAQRALALVFSTGTTADPTPSFKPNVHYASWYQAEQQGLVDMNFAIAPPQIVRFEPGHNPAVPLDFSWFPKNFNWSQHQGHRYRYFFARGASPELIGRLWASAPCAPAQLAKQGLWSVYENKPCQP